MLVMGLTPPLPILAVEQLGICRFAGGNIAYSQLAAPCCKEGILGQVTRQVGQCSLAEHAECGITLSQSGESDTPKHGRFFGIFARGVPRYYRFGLGCNLPPQVIRLKGPAVTLGFSGRLGEPVRIVHPIVVDAAPEQCSDQGESDNPIRPSHCEAPESPESVFRS
jgi:hypothetical protein